MSTESAEERLSLRTLTRDHPFVLLVLIACTLLGAALGAIYLSADWHLARRMAGGALAGAGTGMLFTFNRIYG